MNDIVPPTFDETPEPGGPAVVHRSRRRITTVLVVAVFTVVALVVGSMMVPVPYYRIAPGSVRATEPLIEVQGASTFEDDSEGEISFTTIAFGPVTAFDAAMGWVSPDVEIIPESVALGGQDREENDQMNQHMMDTSKELAAALALQTLGYDVTFEGTGAMVVEVVPDSAADGVLDWGDTIVALDGEPVEVADGLIASLAELAPGTTVTVEVEDLDGHRRTERIRLGERPDEPGLSFLGIGPTTRDFTFVLPFVVDIEAGAVGGPSAGLAFTLGIIDVLTPGDLTGGIDVAVTGSIAPDGRVGPIGGVRQKAVAARNAGVDLFIVPSSSYDEALAGAGDMAVVAVDTLDEALAVLAERGGGLTELDERAIDAGGSATEGG